MATRAEELAHRSDITRLVAINGADLTIFLGCEVDVPPPPQELLTVLDKAYEIDWFQAEARYLPPALGGFWVVVDGSEKPAWRGGIQMYENDPFAQILAQLRRDEKIKVLDPYGVFPKDSRFEISYTELSEHVNPAIAELLGVKSEQVRIPTQDEFILIGNLAHQEWGRTDTWEWLKDQLGEDRHLVGGDSKAGGLTAVHHYWSNGHNRCIGFRPLIVFPT